MTHQHCDGCGAELGRPLNRGRKERLIHGRRDEDSGGGLWPIPDGEFDWCEHCAKAAFIAVLERLIRIEPKSVSEATQRQLAAVKRRNE